MSQQLDTIARLALSGAIVDTYETGAVTSTLPDTPAIGKLLVQLQAETERAFELYDRLTPRALLRVERKIDFIKAKTSIGKPLSIITFIEFAMAVMDQPARMCKGARWAACRNIVSILSALHRELSGGREFILSSIAAARRVMCGIWWRYEGGTLKMEPQKTYRAFRVCLESRKGKVEKSKDGWCRAWYNIQSSTPDKAIECAKRYCCVLSGRITGTAWPANANDLGVR